MRKILLGICAFSFLTCCVREKQYAEFHQPNTFVNVSPEISTETVAWEYPRYSGPGTPMDPREDELLENPINLQCPGVQIIEWRPSLGLEETTGQSDEAINVLNETCNLAFDSFDEFIRTREKIAEDAPQFTWFLCLMPARSEYGGRESRNLNDHFGRFYARPALNESIIYGGWTGHQRRKIFMTNDIFHEDGTLNAKTVTIFAHELFHALSWHYGIFTNVEEDERLAVQFTEYLGLGS